MRQTNEQIIALEASKKNYTYNGSNIDTYPNWVKRGYQVKLNQKAFIKTHLWTSGVNKRKTLQGLFTIDQVTKVNAEYLMLV